MSLFELVDEILLGNPVGPRDGDELVAYAHQFFPAFLFRDIRACRSYKSAGSLLALGSGTELVTKINGIKETEKKVLILGFDGMDPHLVEIWMRQGLLPHFEKLRRQGDFRPLQTSNPPQSPVAWSNFITGCDPGGHAIFDFIHRDPENYIPVFSASSFTFASATLSMDIYPASISFLAVASPTPLIISSEVSIS